MALTLMRVLYASVREVDNNSCNCGCHSHFPLPVSHGYLSPKKNNRMDSSVEQVIYKLGKEKENVVLNWKSTKKQKLLTNQSDGVLSNDFKWCLFRWSEVLFATSNSILLPVSALKSCRWRCVDDVVVELNN